MSLLDGMKDKLGFGAKPEWQDDGYPDSDSDDYGYEDGDYGEGDYGQDGYGQDGYGQDEDYSSGSGTRGSVVSFDAYNPSNFDNVKISSENSPRVASYDDLGKSRYSGRSAGGYGSSAASSRSGASPRASSVRTRAGEAAGSGAVSGSGSSWTPTDPSFLDNQGPAYGTREVMDEIHAADPYSSLGSDFLNASKDPATHLEIVRPKSYSVVEKIATAAKAGKSVVLVVSKTEPALAKRILDFSFGVASALNMNVDKAADRVFVLSRGANMLSEAERAYLAERGILKDES